MTGSFFAEGQEEVGTVKFFKDDRGFGFVEPRNGGNDVFLHASALREAGHHTASEGDQITYVAEHKRGRRAREVTRVINLGKR